MTGSTIRYTSPSGTRLANGYQGDAGIDLPTSESVVIPAGGWANIPVDVCVELPRGVWGMILGRSSTFYRRHLLVNPAVIDEGFRGPLFACCYNASGADVKIDVGERLAQLIPVLLVPCGLEPVEELSPSDRGTSGFGSTGL